MSKFLKAVLVFVIALSLAGCGDGQPVEDTRVHTTSASSSNIVEAPTTTEPVKSIDEAYAEIAALHGVTIGSAESEDCTVEDIVGDAMPELIIWDGRSARGGLLSGYIYGYDAANGEAFQYKGETQLHVPSKGVNGYCIAQSWGNGSWSYYVYQANEQSFELISTIEVLTDGLYIDQVEVDRDIFLDIAKGYVGNDIMLELEEDTKLDSPQQIALSNDEIKDLNVFLSNFVEARFWDYSKDTTDDRALIRFAMAYNKINYLSRYDIYTINGTSYEGIDGSHIQNTVKRFFDRDVTLGTFSYTDQYATYEYLHQDGKMFMEAADGEQFNEFAQVSVVEGMSDGTNKVTFEVYATEFEAPDDSLYNPVSTWTADDHAAARQRGLSGTAIVMPVVLNNRATYQLLELAVY